MDITVNPARDRFPACFDHSCRTVGDPAGFGGQGQMDCIDAANNTTTYLKWLQHDGLPGFHRVMDHARRIGLFAGGPHAMTVIRDTACRQEYAVDPRFFVNGEAAVIMEPAAWKTGWRPGDGQHE